MAARLVGGRSVVYWEGRAATRMEEYLRESSETLEIIRDAYRRANKSIMDEIEHIRKTYAKAFGLSGKELDAYLSAPAGRAEYERLLQAISLIPDKAVRRQLEARAASGAYAFRVSRLQALLDNINAQLARLAAVEKDAITQGLRSLSIQAYNRTMFDLQRGTGLLFHFAKMSNRIIAEILRNPWSGKTFSERIWANAKALEKALREIITSGMMTGQGTRKMAAALADSMGVSYRNAERLVRTEANYIANAAEIESYKECGIEQYRFLAVLDDRTSEVCAELDSSVFNVSEARAGENLPPMHPRCRSTTVAWFGEETMKGMTRRAKDPKTGETYKVPKDMSYKDWERSVA